jgi:hypothetical protein
MPVPTSFVYESTLASKSSCKATTLTIVLLREVSVVLLELACRRCHDASSRVFVGMKSVFCLGLPVGDDKKKSRCDW